MNKFFFAIAIAFASSSVFAVESANSTDLFVAYHLSGANGCSGEGNIVLTLTNKKQIKDTESIEQVQEVIKEAILRDKPLTCSGELKKVIIINIQRLPI